MPMEYDEPIYSHKKYTWKKPYLLAIKEIDIANFGLNVDICMYS